MLQLDPADRDRLWSRLIERVEQYATCVDTYPVSPELDPTKIRDDLARFDFSQPVLPNDALDYAADSLTKWQVHTAHPMYFGLFNPAPTTMGIAADTLVAAFNPQLAAWSHNPFAVEAERHIVLTFAASIRFAHVRRGRNVYIRRHGSEPYGVIDRAHGCIPFIS